MVVHRPISIMTAVLLLLALSCTLALAYMAWQERQRQAFNTALMSHDWLSAATYDKPAGRFVQAYVLAQSDASLQQALQLYSTLIQHDRADTDAVLQTAARYNSANVYLRRALTVDIIQQADIALPLVELAKQGYRELLRQQPQHWNAKYNLERALQLFPDVREKPIQEWEAQERGPRAVISVEADQQLP